MKGILAKGVLFEGFLKIKNYFSYSDIFMPLLLIYSKY